MPRFLLRRRSLGEIATLAATPRRMAKEERSRQVKEVLDFRSAHAADKDVGQWLADVASVAPKAATRAGGLRSGRRRSTRASNASPATTQTLASLPLSGVSVLNMTNELASQLRADLPGYELMEDRPLSLIMPMPSLLAAQPQEDNAWARALVQADEAARQGLSGRGVVVAILDTGVDESHPEIQGKVKAAVTFDGTGQATAMQPSQDTHHHGTHVAGIVAGHATGVAPGASLMNAVMIPQGHGFLSDFLFAMEWAAGNPEVQIINMSAGLFGFDPGMLEAVRDLTLVGILPVFAIGNEGRNQTRSPGNYDPALSVGACDKNRQVASFSGGATIVHESHQYTVPDAVAPGVDVYSCIPGNGYALLSGTSMATPVVSAVAALLLEKYPKASSLDIVDALMASCVDLGYPRDRQGQGLVSWAGADRYLGARPWS